MDVPSAKPAELERGVEVASPCVGKCSLDFFSVCRGCKRTLEEIRAWTRLSNSEKQQVVNRLK
jgi:predicted Fe-S protein YdhL (DUF1289 family)